MVQTFPELHICNVLFKLNLWTLTLSPPRAGFPAQRKCPKHYAPEIRRKKHGRQHGIIPRQISLEGGLPITIGYPDKFAKLPARKNMAVSPENFELP